MSIVHTYQVKKPSLHIRRHRVRPCPSSSCSYVELRSHQSTRVQRTLTFTASATDLDLPVNTLTYSLTGTTNGASINPTTGVFSWTPTARGTYTFTVLVTDNGALFAQRSFTVSVKK